MLPIKYSEEENLYFKNEIKKAIREFMEYTTSEDFMGIILRAQLYIENDLDMLLQKLLIHPDKINFQFFLAKLNAAYALGAIGDEWYGAFRKFNKIRNKYAHDYNYEFQISDYEDLISALSLDAKVEFKSNIEMEEWFISIKNSLTGNQDSLDLKYKLRVLLSDFMLYIKQSHQTFELLWEEIYCIKKEQIISQKISLLDRMRTIPALIE